jgi:hypothetical protein
MKTYIYLIENIEPNTSKIYIGKTKESNLSNRKYTHRTNYGKQISFTIIDETDPLKHIDWKILESFWIEQFKQWGFNLVNKNKGGGGPEYLNNTSKDKLRLIHLGKPRSEETKQKISNSLKGKPKSLIHKEKIKNRTLSKTQLINISNAKSKPVHQYDKKGNFIQEFPSLIQASILLNINYQNLSQHARGYKGCNKSIGGYVFKLKK